MTSASSCVVNNMNLVLRSVSDNRNLTLGSFVYKATIESASFLGNFPANIYYLQAKLYRIWGYYIVELVVHTLSYQFPYCWSQRWTSWEILANKKMMMTDARYTPLKDCTGRSEVSLNSLFHLGPAEAPSYSLNERGRAAPEDPWAWLAGSPGKAQVFPV